MIPEAFIDEWAQSHPWSTVALVEQDLLISRALAEIFSDPFLRQEVAFRGGTALHKLYLNPQPRYSEDIDLVQINPGPIRPIMDHLREALDFLGEPKTKSTPMSNKLLYRVNSEDPAVPTIRIKIEINCREHFHILPRNRFPFSVENSWYSRNCEITTYQLDELLGTKMRALYQRSKGRDLFDLSRALTHSHIDSGAILNSFVHYIYFSAKYIPTQKEFELNMEDKLQDDDFLVDTQPILLPGIDFCPVQAYREVHDSLIAHIDPLRKDFMMNRTMES